MARKLTDFELHDVPTYSRICAERRLIGMRKAFDRGRVTKRAVISAAYDARKVGADETTIAACVRDLVR